MSGQPEKRAYVDCPTVGDFKLRRYDLDRIEDDRVLARAFATGGRPTLELIDPDGSLPEPVRGQLVARTG